METMEMFQNIFFFFFDIYINKRFGVYKLYET